MVYTAKQVIWHTKELRYVQPGEVIDLGHLDANQIDLLIANGVVEEARAETPARETKSKKKEE